MDLLPVLPIPWLWLRSLLGLLLLVLLLSRLAARLVQIWRVWATRARVLLLCSNGLSTLMLK